MDRDYDKEIIEDDITRIVRQAFGVDEDQILRDFLLAQTEIKDDQIPPEPEDGFEQLLKKMKDRNIRPKYIHASDNIIRIADESPDANAGEAASRTGSTSHTRRPRRLKTLVKVAVVAAVLMAMVFGMGITARARRRYTFDVTERDISGIDIMYNKGNIASQEDSLSDAYQTIYDELGINVMKFAYIPERMLLVKTNIDKNRATMFFEYDEKMIYVIQQIRLEGSSFNRVTDRKKHKEVFNNVLDRKLFIEKNKTESGETEFQFQVTEQDVYYSIEGIMEEKEFEKIVENVYFEKRVRGSN